MPFVWYMTQPSTPSSLGGVQVILQNLSFFILLYICMYTHTHTFLFIYIYISPLIEMQTCKAVTHYVNLCVMHTFSGVLHDLLHISQLGSLM